jgi:hypothetical protein
VVSSLRRTASRGSFPRLGFVGLRRTRADLAHGNRTLIPTLPPGRPAPRTRRGTPRCRRPTPAGCSARAPRCPHRRRWSAGRWSPARTARPAGNRRPRLQDARCEARRDRRERTRRTGCRRPHRPRREAEEADRRPSGRRDERDGRESVADAGDGPRLWRLSGTRGREPRQAGPDRLRQRLAGVGSPLRTVRIPVPLLPRRARGRQGSRLGDNGCEVAASGGDPLVDRDDGVEPDRPGAEVEDSRPARCCHPGGDAAADEGCAGERDPPELPDRLRPLGGEAAGVRPARADLRVDGVEAAVGLPRGRRPLPGGVQGADLRRLRIADPRDSTVA